jgi:hypothetical protein
MLDVAAGFKVDVDKRFVYLAFTSRRAFREHWYRYNHPRLHSNHGSASPSEPLSRTTTVESNLFFLFLAWTATTIFTPFTTLVRGSIWLIDEKLGSGSLMAWTWSLLGKSREYYKILV